MPYLWLGTRGWEQQSFPWSREFAPLWGLARLFLEQNCFPLFLVSPGIGVKVKLRSMGQPEVLPQC